MAKYGVVDHHEMSCYFSKSRLGDSGCTEIVGNGLEIKHIASGSGVYVISQMHILSLSALWLAQ